MAFTSMSELIDLSTEKNMPIYELMIESEIIERGADRSDLVKKMSDQLDVMIDSVHQGTQQPAYSKTGITGGDGYKMTQYKDQSDTYTPSGSLEVLANAMAVNEVNAAMGRIVATPTAGSAGVLPAVLTKLYDSGDYTKDELVNCLFTAAALGLVIANRASISGAEGGCQAEIGSATAMAAGALVELKGGSAEQVSQALALALQNSLGLVCDPVAGLVEVPCITRNGFHSLTAMAAADMALAGVKCAIPADEVIDAMDDVGRQMPESLRETGIGGMAGTPTGKKIAEEVLTQDAQEEVDEESHTDSASDESVSADYKSAYEIIGPIMIGPSSSHTAGAVRIGNVARQLLGEEPVEVVFTLMGSFAETYQGHGTDKALIAGVLGYSTRDEEVSEAEEIAKEKGLKYNFLKRDLGNYHPNTVRVHVWGENKHAKIIASSIGGGKIEVQEANDYPIKFSGEKPTFVINHPDQAGAVSQITSYLFDNGFNISHMANRRVKIDGPAMTVVEVDQQLDEDIVNTLKEKLPFIESVQLILVP